MPTDAELYFRLNHRPGGQFLVAAQERDARWPAPGLVTEYYDQVYGSPMPDGLEFQFHGATRGGIVYDADHLALVAAFLRFIAKQYNRRTRSGRAWYEDNLQSGDYYVGKLTGRKATFEHVRPGA
jgi:hypothetical protein